MMHFLYSLLLTLAFFALLPVFVYQALFRRKYLANLRERLGLLPAALRSDGRPTIWLHAVSVGETLSALALIKAMRTRFPQHRLLISTTTMTGQAIARERGVGAGGADGVCYFPFDWRFSVRRALDTIQPQLIVLLESELWWNFLSECQQRRIPVVVVNGRISDRSFPRSQRFGFFIRRLYGLVTCFLMQSPLDAERARALGALAERVQVSGNLKYDLGQANEPGRMTDAVQQLAARWALAQTPLIVAGSICEGEEDIVLTAFARLRATHPDVRLLIAPRHPERFDVVARLLESAGLRFVRRSQTADIPAATAQVLLLDSVGELAALYRFAALVFVGGSLITKGGHNILEPALYAKPIVVGPHMHNFREITQEFLRRDAVMQLQARDAAALSEELCGVWRQLLEERRWAQTLGENARQAIEENRGATERTVAALATLLES